MIRHTHEISCFSISFVKIMKLNADYWLSFVNKVDSNLCLFSYIVQCQLLEGFGGNPGAI